MSKQAIKTAIRLLVLAVAAMVMVHILTHDDRNNLLAIIPGVVLASAAFHFTKLGLSRRMA